MAFSSHAVAESEAAMPEGWQDWPVVKEGRIPSNDKPIPDNAPAILKETITTYNWINDGKGSDYAIRFHPDKKGASEYKDGPTAVLHLKDIGVILVTEHLMGDPVYGAYTVDGKDMSGAHPSLKPKACRDCHSGYGESCPNGVCSQ